MKTFLNTCAIVALSATLLGCETTGTDTSSITPRPITAAGGVQPLPADLEAALRQAQTQRRNKEYEAAGHTLSQLVLVAPDDHRVLGEYGKVLAGQNRTDDAIAFLERATQLNQKDWTLFSALGVAYDQKGDYKAAQAAYARALTMKPGDPTILSNAALSHLQAGDIASARRLMQQAARTGGADPKIAKNLAFIESLEAPAAPKPAATAAVTRPAAQPAKPAPATAAAPAPTRTASTAAPAKPNATPAPASTANRAPTASAPAKPATTAQSDRAAATTTPAVLRRSD
jgi:Flp pilus assembly protein TadD